MSAATLYLTPHERALHDSDGGFAARLAAGLERAAAETRTLPDGLMPAVVNQYFYAIQGTDADRHAAVDAWAARHHVPSGWKPGTGYCARVATPEMTMMAVAISEAEHPAPRDETRKLAAA